MIIPTDEGFTEQDLLDVRNSGLGPGLRGSSMQIREGGH